MMLCTFSLFADPPAYASATHIHSGYSSLPVPLNIHQPRETVRYSSEHARKPLCVCTERDGAQHIGIVSYRMITVHCHRSETDFVVAKPHGLVSQMLNTAHTKLLYTSHQSLRVYYLPTFISVSGRHFQEIPTSALRMYEHLSPPHELHGRPEQN